MYYRKKFNVLSKASMGFLYLKETEPPKLRTFFSQTLDPKLLLYSYYTRGYRKYGDEPEG